MLMLIMQRFYPERFRENIAHRFAYLPFSLGTRSCIGNPLKRFCDHNRHHSLERIAGEKLAMLEIKVITAMVASRPVVALSFPFTVLTL